MKLYRLIIAALLALFPATAFAANNLSSYGTATYDTTAQKFGTAAYKGSASTNLYYPNQSPFYNGNSFTWSVWVKLPAKPSAIVVALGAGNYGYIGITANGFGVCNVAGTNNPTVTGSTNIADGNWHLVEMDTSSSNMYCFVDGGLIGSTTGGTPQTGANQSAFQIGGLSAANDGSGQSFAFVNGEIDEVAVWNGIQHTASYTVPTAAYTGTEGMVALYHLDSAATDSANSLVTFTPDNASIYYSYQNWACSGSTYCATANSGAYFKTLFTGNSCQLTFNVAQQNATYPSEIYVDVDGVRTQANLAATVPCTPGAQFTNTGGGYQPTTHTLRVILKSTSGASGVTRWAAPTTSNTAAVLTGVQVATGSTLKAPKVYPLVCGFAGDSITEGIRTVSQVTLSGSNDADQNDATTGWAWNVAERLGCEPSIIGWGSQGYTTTGTGSVPVFGTGIQSILPNFARTFSGYNLFVVNIGANDCATYQTSSTAAQVTTAATAALNTLEAALPSSARLVVMDWLADPAGQYYSNRCTSILQNAIAASNSPSRVNFIGTSGFFSAATYGGDSLGLHPSGSNDMTIIAPQVQAALRSIMTVGAPVQCTGSKSCAIASGTALAGG